MESMSVAFIILGVLYLIGCVALVGAILLQKKRAAGMGSIAGMGDMTTYLGKNKDRSMEGSLERWTKIGAVVLGIFAVVLCLI